MRDTRVRLTGADIVTGACLIVTSVLAGACFLASVGFLLDLL